MDRQTIEHHLAQAQRHVSEGEQHLARQRELLAQFVRNGYDTTEAEKLLANFENSQRLHIADRDRLAKELAALR